jgi:ElaB/YqjD/DUF883 family membrane-anchored ribosome-binding protein
LERSDSTVAFVEGFMITQEDAKQGLINDQMGTQLEALSARMEANLERGRNAWAEWRSTLSDSSNRAIDAAEAAVREKPWQVAMGAALVGVVLGYLCSRNR